MMVGGNLRTLGEGERERTLKKEGDNGDQKDARGIRDGLIKRFIPNFKPILFIHLRLFL